MEWAGTCLLIVLGRVGDVTLGTLRTIAVVRGRRYLASLLGFFEVLIWVFVITRVIQGLQEHVVLGISYAFGFALGNFIGVSVDEWLALGQQAVLIISKNGQAMADHLRQEGVRLTVFDGKGRDGPTTLLFLAASRHQIPSLMAKVEAFDQECFYTVEDIRLASSLAARLHQPTGWRTVLKRK